MPYIMGIDGCIHDGWLLIRSTSNIFDLAFLCHLLGTPQMLNQYRSPTASSTVNNLNKKLVGNTVAIIPETAEQRVLGQYLEQLDHLIPLQQRKAKKSSSFVPDSLFIYHIQLFIAPFKTFNTSPYYICFPLLERKALIHFAGISLSLSYIREPEIIKKDGGKK